MTKRLFLLGDADALDVLAELAAHLDYDVVHRADEPPAAVTDGDHVVIGMRIPSHGRDLLRRILDLGDPAYLGLIAPENEAMISLLKLAAERVPKARLDRIAAPAGLGAPDMTPGEQALSVAAELVAARHGRR